MSRDPKSEIRDSKAKPSSISNLEFRISNHKIYTGSFALLEQRWMDTISELQQGDALREIDVLVGSNVLASYLKRRLAENGRVAANIRFCNFLDLASRFAGAPGEGGNARLSRVGATVILENLLAGNPPEIYAPLAGYRGFRDALSDTFRDLRDAGILPGELENAIHKIRNSDRRTHLSGFAGIYRSYRESVGRFQDVDDDFRAAVHNLEWAKESPGLRQLMVYGIYDVTGQQASLLSALKDQVDMIYFIPYVDGTVSEFARPFAESRASELGVSPVRLESPPPAGTLEFLASRGFGLSGRLEGKGPAAADGSIAFVSAPGESRAAVEIVREIFRAVRDGTIKGFHEAAVVLRQPESDIPVLTEMLRLRGVPHFVHGGRSFSERPLGKALVALSALQSNSFSREAVLSAMELTAAALSEDAVSSWDVQGWRVLTNDPRFLAGLESWNSGTEALVQKARGELAKAEAQPVRPDDLEPGEGARPVWLLRKRLESAMRLREAWTLIKEAVNWPASRPWSAWSALIDERLEPLLGKSEDWPLLSSVLDEIGSLGEFEIRDSKFEIGEAVPVNRLRSALLEAISSRSCPVGKFQRSGVNLLSASAARGLRFPLVIIPGLDEGRFPARLRQDPLLLDSERSLFKTLPLKARRIEEEKLLFDMAARSAEKRLVLMTSRLDETSDREQIPSQFFLRVASAVCGRAVAIRDLTEEIISGFRSVSLDNPAPAKNEIPVDEGEIRLRLITAGSGSPSFSLQMLASMEPLRLTRPQQYDKSRWVKRLTSYDGHIADPALVQWTAQRLGASAGQVSASRIEEYVKCPYSFFLKRAMNLQAWEEQGKIEAMDPLERGLAIHAILEKFLRESGEDVFRSADQGLEKQLEALARESLDSARPAGIADLLWEIEREALVRMLKGWLKFEKARAVPAMRVSRLEQVFGDFGPEEKFPAFRVKAGRHTFDFRGRIDRIDFSNDRRHASVVDYKTGALPESMANKSIRTPLMSGERIQIVVYAGALSVLEGFNEVETLEGEYLHLNPRNGLATPCSFTHEEIQRASRELCSILELVGDGIESGIFFARTSGRIRPAGHCDYCDYLPVCGKDRIQREERKAKDPVVCKFLETTEPV